MSSPRTGIAMRTELVRSVWHGSMTGKSLRKIGSVAVQEVCLRGEGGGLGEDLVHLEAGLEANRTCSREQEIQREGLVWR
jgi:hypothetical protein